MFKRTARWGVVILAAAVLFACAEAKREVTVQVKATLDGSPAAQARVILDGAEVGVTAEDGTLAHKVMKLSGDNIKVSVVKEAMGYEIEPWEGSVTVNKPGETPGDKYALEVVLKSSKGVAISVTDKGSAVEGALVKIDGRNLGTTDTAGQIKYSYEGQAVRKIRLEVEKKGYVTWKKSLEIKPGTTAEAAIFKPSVLTIRALTEEYGQEIGLPGISVWIGKKSIGKTGENGSVSYVYRGAPGRSVTVGMSVPGYTPSVWKAKVVLDGRRSLKRYFYNTALKTVRTGIYGYSSNAPDEDMTAILRRLEEAVGNILYSHMVFSEVPKDTLRENIKQAETDVDRITSAGWNNTTLIKAVDAVILGSVSRNNRGYTIETKVFSSDGTLVLSQINTARRVRDVKKVAKKIANNILADFPFKATLVSIKDGNKINMGKSSYGLKRGMEFSLQAPDLAKYGRISGYRDIGTIKLRKVGKRSSTGEIIELKSGKKAVPGQRVMRRSPGSREAQAAGGYVTLTVKGGVPPEIALIAGVNIYIDEEWAGSTSSRGTARIPLKIGRNYDLVLYKHGYQQFTGRIKAAADRENKDYVLHINNASFRAESRPSGADVFLDGVKVGKTPMTGGLKVNFGFHTLKMSASGDYRDFEEVVEFNKGEVDYTGSKKIVLVKDYMKQGKRAERVGDFDSAIAAYSSPGMDHPDYSNARFRLAQIYMDEKEDFNSAIKEFENVLSLPENQQLIYKQFSIAYTNLGHAYYELGNNLIREDRLSAAQKFSKASENLEKAKQNTRFFPTQYYNEALHDTYYYLALSYHKLYLLTRKETILGRADLAWREYFDFFPKQLEGDEVFTQMRDSARKYWTQIQDLM